MKQIRIHGRGGHGGKKMAKLIAQAAFLEGKEVQSFALYGAERRGAPVMSFVRIDDKPIQLRGYITNPDVVIVLDDGLLEMDTVNVDEGFDYDKDGSFMIINSSGYADNAFCVDGTKIAMDIIGKNIINTTMLGIFCGVTGLVKLESLEKAIRMEFNKLSKKVVNANVLVMKKCYEAI